MTYLKNCWYMFAWSNELGDRPFARTILDIPVVVYKSESDGRLIALLDRCPHRFAPLSLGKIVGDNLQCGYHGLEFNDRGKCVRNPFSSAVPPARVDSYPVVEKDRAIWIWPGDAELASPELIPDLPHHVDPNQQCVFGLTTAKSDYRLLSDNLMDLSHSAFLHPAFGGLNYMPKIRSWEDADGSITADFLIESMENFIGHGVDAEYVRNHDRIRWIAPSAHILDSRIGPVGEEPTMHVPSAHILTPETATSTHYFWSSGGPKDSGISDEDMIAFLKTVFDDEDKPMVEAVQQRMGGQDLWDLNPILLPNDAGAVRVRRKLASLIKAEQANEDVAA